MGIHVTANKYGDKEITVDEETTSDELTTAIEKRGNERNIWVLSDSLFNG